MRHRRWHLVVLLTLGAVALTAAPASADHMDDHGTIVGGVSSESEAVAYPCPKAPGGSYATTGPVVCFAKRASVWSLTWENNGYSCSYGPAGWTGNCIFDNDMGDYIKVWGTRGIPDTNFTVRWGHATVTSENEPTPGGGAAPPSGGGSGGSTGGYAGGTGSSPSAPSGPSAPPPPGGPGYYTPSAPGSPGMPSAPGAPGTPGTITGPDLGSMGRVDTGGSGSDTRSAGTGENAAAHGGSGDKGSPWVPITVVVVLLAAAAGGAVMVSRQRA